MPYSIDSDTRTLTNSLGDTILTAATDRDMPALSKIADAANGTPSGQTKLIYAPDLNSFVDPTGEISVMLTGVEDRPAGKALVGASNKVVVVPPAPFVCTPTSLVALTSDLPMRELGYDLAVKIDGAEFFQTAFLSQQPQLSELRNVLGTLIAGNNYDTFTVSELTLTGYPGETAGDSHSMLINTAESPSNAGYLFFGAQPNNSVTIHTCGKLYRVES